MKIILEKDAKEYIEIKSKDNSINLSIFQVKTGWCSTNQLSVKIGNPKNIDNYTFHEVDGIRVYLQNGLIVPKEEIKISLKKALLFKTLNVEGIYV